MWRLRYRIHGSWVVALVSACFVIGVTLSVLFRLPWWVGLFLIVPLGIGCAFRTVWSTPIIASSALLLGVSYGSAHIGTRYVYATWLERSAQVSGRVKEDPLRTASGVLSVQLDAVQVEGSTTPGTIYVSIRGSPQIKRGDILTVSGIIKPGFGSFPVSVSTVSVDSLVRPVPGDMGRVVRDWFADHVREKIPDPQASLGIGFLTGQKSALPEDLSEALRIAGLTHIVVASGYNLTVLVRMARRLFIKVSKFLSAAAAGMMIVLFVGVTGVSPSMARAGLVSSMSLLSWYYGHAFHPFVLLPVAAAITVALQPSYVWGDLGWQLSFAAFAGVMIVAPLMQRYLYGEKDPGVIRQILGETIAAHLVTLPIIALSFGTVSHVAIIANILVVPLVPLAMLLTFITGVWAIVALPFSSIIAWPTELLLDYMVQVAYFVSELSWAQSELTISGWLWAGYVCALGTICVWMWRATRYSFRGDEPLL